MISAKNEGVWGKGAGRVRGQDEMKAKLQGPWFRECMSQTVEVKTMTILCLGTCENEAEVLSTTGNHKEIEADDISAQTLIYRCMGIFSLLTITPQTIVQVSLIRLESPFVSRL